MEKKISELKDKDKNVSVKAVVVSKEKPRSITTKYGLTKISEALIENASGNIILVLWGDQTSQVNEGDEVEITNGYVQEWNKILKLSVGKYGSLKVVK